MKKKIKRGITPVILAIICGSICGKLVCDIYIDKAATNLESSKIYLIQAGAYSTYDNMVNNTNVANYIYYEDDDGLYKTIIGITENQNNIEKIKSTYNGNVIIREYYSNNNELNQKIKNYDKKINKLEDISEIKKIVLEMLALYKDNQESILVKID